MPKSAYLTQAEVDALPADSEVIITWTGGNGPHKYTIGKYYGDSYTTYETADGVVHLGHLIDFVGDMKPFTLVQLVEATIA